ncbi:hypothetical protein [Streptacidiphilus anmyonensis]|uniref:hypothetical protein n=1 Tax=Streptacidiphilus anmyonensis TaxID=405782 RepID=UPI0005A8A390|nr:hypothetical protein [Streptacidiphilus anmyonensis]
MPEFRSVRPAIAKATTTAVVLGAAFAGTVALAPGAQAATGGGCRNWFTSPAGQWAGEPLGVSLDSCAAIKDTDNSDIEANIGFQSKLGIDIDPCAQLVNAVTGARVHDYGCIGWIGSDKAVNETYSGWRDSWVDVGKGAYVVQVGFWAYNANNQLQYYGNVQSPRVNQ